VDDPVDDQIELEKEEGDLKDNMERELLDIEDNDNEKSYDEMDLNDYNYTQLAFPKSYRHNLENEKEIFGVKSK